MTDEEIIELAEKTYKYKPQEGCVFCDDCPMFICANSKGCVLTAYKQGFLDGYKAAYNEIKIDVNKLTLGDVKFAIEHSPYYAELLLRAVGESFKKIYRDVVIKNNKND